MRLHISDEEAVSSSLRALCVFVPMLTMAVLAPGQENNPQGQSLGRQSVQAGPVMSVSNFSSTPPAYTDAQRKSQESALARTHLRAPIAAQSPNIAGPQVGRETVPSNSPVLEPEQAAPNSPAPQSLSFFINRVFTPSNGGLSTSNIAEQSVAESGQFVWVTGNWFAARSTLGGGTGTSFSFVNPYADYSDFCCDQQAIADRGRDLLLWYRQGLYNSSTHQGSFKLGASTDGGATWCTYTTQPVNVNSSLTDDWFDYPRIALTDNYLYISPNVFAGSGAFVGQYILRWPLDSLKSCSTFSYNWHNEQSGWAGMANGGTTNLYVGDHMGTNNSFRVYYWPESTTTIFWWDHTIPAFTFENGGSCVVSGGTNPCSRADSRVNAGWVAKTTDNGTRTVGFMWNAAAGGGFPLPYTEAATFQEENLAGAPIGRPFVWSSNATWQYANVHPNARGDLGVSIFVLGGGVTTYPSSWFLIYDDQSVVPPGWENWSVKIGAGGANGWGDFTQIRSFLPTQTGWVTAMWTIQSGAAQPGYTVIARPRDIPGIQHFYQK